MDKKKKPSRSTVYRHKRARAAAQAGCNCTEQGLPMPYALLPEEAQRHKVEVVDHFHYEEHHRRHLELFPDYDAQWERPTPETARAVYDLVKNYVPALDKIHSDEVTAMQLITGTLDVAVVSGRYGHRRERNTHMEPDEELQHVKRAVQRNTLTDAIMHRWSDHARLARRDGRAYALTQMTETTARNAWRDLRVNHIHVEVLWPLITGHTPGQRHPLFRARPSWMLKRQDVAGYDIELHDGPALEEFERLVGDDRYYKGSRVSHTWRLWIDGEDPPLVDIHPPICAERVFNKVTFGDRTESVRKIQENVRLLFDAGLFVADYEANHTERLTLKREIKVKFPTETPWEDRTKEERELRYRAAKRQVFAWEFYSIYEQVTRLKKKDDLVKIRSGFYKVLNRRWQPAHFWPMQVSNQKVAEEFRFTAEELKPGAMPNPDKTAVEVSQRDQWFLAPDPINGAEPLISMDISASQTQIQAILLGIEDMEQDAVLSPRPHKVGLAERAWAAHVADIAAGKGPLLIGYTGPTDKRLIDMMKNLWMVLGYGSSVSNILWDQKKDPRTYGKGWRTVPTLLDYKAINAVLHEVPGYQARADFLNTCRAAGVAMMEENPYAGATVVDPLDNTEFKWNRPLMAAASLWLNDWEITLVRPGEYGDERCPRCGGPSNLRGARLRCNNWKTCKVVWNAEFVAGHDHKGDGNLLLDGAKLRKMISPCIIHMLDSLFSSLVMEALVADGVTNFAGVHDCWYVPQTIYHTDGRESEDGHVVVNRAIKDAGKPWLLALGPVYQWLLDNVGGEQIEEAHRKWLARVERGNQGDQSAWPHFFAVPSGPSLL